METILFLLIGTLLINAGRPLKYFNAADFYTQSFDISSDYLKWSETQNAKLLLLRQNRSGNFIPTLVRNKEFSHKKNTSPTVMTDKLVQPHSDIFQNKQQQVLFATSEKAPTYSKLLNQSLNTTTPRVVYSTPTAFILGLLTAVVSLVTIVGNILVLIAFIVERAVRTASNYFLASLAVTDVLIGIFSMNLYTVYLLLGYWPLGRLTCDLWLSLDYTACLTSQYTVLLITIDRFCSVSMPAKYRNWRTDTKILIQVAVTWIVPSCVFFTTIMGWPYFNTSMSPRPLNECYAEFANDPIFNTVFTVCYFWITLYVMCGLYVGIYRVALDLQKRSDEKRNRVSGFITMNEGNNTTRNDKTKIGSCHRNAANKIGKNESKRSSNRTNVNENNNRNNNNDNKNVKNQLLRNNSSLYGGEDSSGFDSDETKPVVHKPQLNKEKEPEPRRIVKIEARCDVEPFNFPPKLIATNTNKSVNSPKTNTHTTTYDTELHSITPTSVMSTQLKGFTISSPILVDDDNGVEISYNTVKKFEFPSSPALFDLSDVEEAAVRTTKLASENEKVNTPGMEENVKANENERDCEELENDCPLDPGYQNRVLEQFKQRLAAMNINSSSTTVNENQSFAGNPLNYDTSNLNLTKSTGCMNSTKAVCNGKLDYGTQMTSANSSPIWKSKPHINDGLVSVPCSLESYQCLICIKQLDSDTIHSSSSYDDYMGVSMCDQKCLCHLDTNYVGKPSVSTYMKEYCLAVLYKIKSLNVRDRLTQLLARKRKINVKVTERGRRENRARKALRTITFILGAFVLCWTPYHVVIIIKGICDNVEQKYTCVNEIFYSITYWLCYVNSPINPFCYALANEQFKKTFIRILRGDLRRT